MELKIQSGDITKLETPCLILGVYKKSKLAPAAQRVDEASAGVLSRLLGKGDLSGEKGGCLVAYDVDGIAAERVLLVGLGKRKELDRGGVEKALGAALTRLSAATLAVPQPPAGMDLYQTVRQCALQVAYGSYRYEHTKKPDKDAPPPMTELTCWVGDKADVDTAEQAIRHAGGIAEGVALARELGNLPGNICTPTYLADQAVELGKRYDGLDVEVLDESDMEALGMNALLSVSRGSRQPAKLIVLHYRGSKGGKAGSAKKAEPAERKPLVLVGKGLTFDAGGISIKPSEAMDEMKYDMAGGASVLGAMVAVCEMELPIDVIGVVPASENLPDGAANKPGDIVKSLSGQTIEILNTDAEGRLILCDALTYVERFEPELVLDMATLTGACIVALGRHPSGLFTADDKLAREITAAGEAAGDRVWRLPLWDDYQKQLDSNFADMANIGGRDGGAITAAAFLARYTKKYPWAHLDIAGTAWLTGKEKGATGRPVPLLAELLIRRSGAAS
jgi:leucyl aminopeptidase